MKTTPKKGARAPKKTSASPDAVKSGIEKTRRIATPEVPADDSPWMTGKRTVDERTRSRLETLADRLVVASTVLKYGAAGGEGEGINEHEALALHKVVDQVAANLIDIAAEAEKSAEADAADRKAG